MVTSTDGQGPAGGLRLPHLEGDHSPRHVHVYKDGELVVKWDLDSWQPMKGRASARVLRLIRELEDEGEL